jgi:hypothetical protein
LAGGVHDKNFFQFIVIPMEKMMYTNRKDVTTKPSLLSSTLRLRWAMDWKMERGVKGRYATGRPSKMEERTEKRKKRKKEVMNRDFMVLMRRDCEEIEKLERAKRHSFVHSMSYSLFLASSIPPPPSPSCKWRSNE